MAVAHRFTCEQNCKYRHCLLDKTGQDAFHKGLRSTWRHPVSCTRDRLQYSMCSVCMNHCDSSYPTVYTPLNKESARNGWKEPNGRALGRNLYYTSDTRLQEEKEKEGAVLCFGHGIINLH